MSIAEALPAQQEPDDAPEVPQSGPYSLDDTTRLMVLSYRFSQGSIYLQEGIFGYLASRFGDKLDLDVIQDARPKVIEAATRIVKNPNLHTANRPVTSQQVVDDVFRQTDEFKGRLQNRLEPSLELLGAQIISRDLMYLKKGYDPNSGEGGGHTDTEIRPRAVSGRPRAVNDPHLSQFVYYGLMGQSTGLPEYNQMFQEVTKAIVESDAEDLTHHMHDALRLHLKHHPEQIELLPEQYRSLLS